MSQNKVIQFFDAVFNNKILQGQINYGFAKFAPEALKLIAQENGYKFTIEDLKSALNTQEELSNEQLAAVVGGAVRGPKPKFIDFTDDPHFIELDGNDSGLY